MKIMLEVYLYNNCLHGDYSIETPDEDNLPTEKATITIEGSNEMADALYKKIKRIFRAK